MLSDQILELQLLPDHSSYDHRHLINRIVVPEVMLVSELRYVAVQMLLAWVVKCTMISTFQDCPKRFDPVCMGQFTKYRRHSSLLLAVPDRGMVAQSLIAKVFIGEYVDIL